MARKTNNNGAANGATLDSLIDGACNILRRSNCASALQYIPELTWILFLRILDAQDAQRETEAAMLGVPFVDTIAAPYRWRDWASKTGAKRKSLDDAGGSLKAFVDAELLPHLKALRDTPNAGARQKIVSEVLSGVQHVRVDVDYNFKEVLDKIDAVQLEKIDITHIFPLSQVYERLLLKMGEKSGDGGQFFTPREVIRAVVRVINPQPGESVYDPGCGTGGFLAQAFEHMKRLAEERGLGVDDIERLGRSFYGREKDDQIYPIALANLVLHGIDEPRIWHGNTLTGNETYGGLFAETAEQYDIVLMNPPFGGKEGDNAQTNFAFKTGATQVLFVQHVLECLKDGGQCGIVLDEGFSFKTNEEAFVKTKRKLLNECDLWCIVSLPGGVFTTAGAGVKTNLLFFRKGAPTTKIWYYDLSGLKVNKGNPLTLPQFASFFELLPTRGDSDLSWTVDFAARRVTVKEKAAPLRAEALAHKEAIGAHRDTIALLKTLNKRNAPPEIVFGTNTSVAAQLAEHTDAMNAAIVAERKATGDADAIEDAVYDLKAVNPNAPDTGQRLTPSELMTLIAARAQEADAALASLQALFAEG